MDDDYDEDKGWEEDRGDGDVCLSFSIRNKLPFDVYLMCPLLIYSRKVERRRWKIHKKF